MTAMELLICGDGKDEVGAFGVGVGDGAGVVVGELPFRGWGAH